MVVRGSLLHERYGPLITLADSATKEEANEQNKQIAAKEIGFLILFSSSRFCRLKVYYNSHSKACQPYNKTIY
jgi:hypothetical protein